MQEPEQAVDLMRETISAIQKSASGELAAEITETEQQLARMVEQAEHRAKSAAADYDDYYNDNEEDEG